MYQNQETCSEDQCHDDDLKNSGGSRRQLRLFLRVLVVWRLCCPWRTLKLLLQQLPYIPQDQPVPLVFSLLSTTYQRHRDDVFGDNGLFCVGCRRGVAGGGWVTWREGEAITAAFTLWVSCHRDVILLFFLTFTLFFHFYNLWQVTRNYCKIVNGSVYSKWLTQHYQLRTTCRNYYFTIYFIGKKSYICRRSYSFSNVFPTFN